MQPEEVSKVHLPNGTADSASQSADAGARETESEQNRRAIPELERLHSALEQEIRERRRVEVTLRRKLELERVVSNISSRFVGDFDMDSAANATLEEMGKTIGASCSCLFLLREDGLTIENTHSWCAEGVLQQIDELKKLSGDMFSWWRAGLSRGQIIYIRNISEIPNQAKAAKEILERIGVKSLLALPVYFSGKLGGFLWLCYLVESGLWSKDELSLLRVSSDIIGRAFEQRAVVEALRESEGKYRNLFLSSPGSVVVFATDGTVIDCKSPVSKISRLRREEIIGKPFKQLIQTLGCDPEEHNRIFSRLIAGEDLKPFELSIVRPDGEKRWIEVFPSVLKKDGKIYALQVISEDITERKQAEEKLKESEERFRAIFDNAADGLLLAGPEDRRFYGANRMICQMLGYSPEELVKLGVNDIHPQESLLYVIDQFEKQDRGELLLARDIPVKRKGGTVFYADISTSPVTFAGKRYLLGIFRDVTERKRAIEALWESEERYRALVDNTVLGITVMDTNYKIITTNAALAKLFRKSPGDFVGKYCFREYEKREAVCSHCPGARAMVSGKTEEIETQGVLDDGSRVAVRNRAIPLFGSDGVMKGFIEVVEDIGERKKAEEELKESEERFRTIFDNAVDGLLLADVADKTFHGANRMICQMLGYSKEELDKLRVDDIHPKKGLPYVIGQFEKQYRGETVVAKDAPVKRKDGSIFYADISASVVTLAGKKYLLGIFRDITERREAEERLRVYQAHLRTLASELSLAEERERRRIAEDLHDHVSQALAVAKIKLATLEGEASSRGLATQLNEIRKLLDESVEHTRAMTFELSPPVLYELGFEAAIEWIAEQFQKQHNIPCDFEDDGEPKPLDEDVRIILFKATRELLLNVAKHARAKKARVSICKVGKAVQITVEDDGIGFHTSVQDAQSSAAGGFGLFSIRERLNYIGGQVEIDSSPGRGTRVILTAPLRGKKKIQKER